MFRTILNGSLWKKIFVPYQPVIYNVIFFPILLVSVQYNITISTKECSWQITILRNKFEIFNSPYVYLPITIIKHFTIFTSSLFVQSFSIEVCLLDIGLNLKKQKTYPTCHRLLTSLFNLYFIKKFKNTRFSKQQFLRLSTVSCS